MRIEEATEQDYALLNTAIERFHPELSQFGVKIKVLRVGADLDDNGDPKGPALKLHGSPCAATIKAQNQTQQFLTGFSFLMKLDMDLWEELSEESRLALLDHELTHCVLVRDKNNDIKKDDNGNPKVRCCPDDYTINGFFEVIERHGANANEYNTLMTVHRKVHEFYGTRLRDTLPTPTIEAPQPAPARRRSPAPETPAAEETQPAPNAPRINLVSRG